MVKIFNVEKIGLAIKRLFIYIREDKEDGWEPLGVNKDNR